MKKLLFWWRYFYGDGPPGWWDNHQWRKQMKGKGE